MIAYFSPNEKALSERKDVSKSEISRINLHTTKIFSDAIEISQFLETQTGRSLLEDARPSLLNRILIRLAGSLGIEILRPCDSHLNRCELGELPLKGKSPLRKYPSRLLYE